MYRSQRTIDIEPTFRKVTPIGYDYEDRDPIKFVATGFYYYHQWGITESEKQDDLPSTGPYIVTNKHIVLPNDSPDPNSLTAYTRNSSDLRSTTRHHINLYNRSGEPLWREHPNNKNIDIAMIPVNFEINSAEAFHRGDLLADPSRVSGGQMAQVIGYPEALENFHRLPILRQALVSSPFRIAYRDSPYFVIDARLHDGMSGSPVVYSPGYIELESPIQESDFQYSGKIKELKGRTERSHSSLLGVHSGERVKFSQQIPVEDILEDLPNSKDRESNLEEYLKDLDKRVSNIESETGVNRVWHAKYLDDIIRNI